MISNMLRFTPSFFEGLDEVFTLDPVFSAVRQRDFSYPQVNMGVTDKSVEIYLFIPGMEADSLDVSIEKILLSVAAKRINKKPEDKDTISRCERFVGRFKRVITLPEDVDPDNTEATYKNGVLHISVAKRKDTLPRKISVNV